MADTSLAVQPLSINALIGEMLEADKWSWAAALVSQAPHQVDPQVLLEQACRHSGGGDLADQLMCQALDMGANPDCLMSGPADQKGYPLAWAALAHRPQALARLLNLPESRGWLAAPVGSWPLAHQLLAHRGEAVYVTLRQAGMPEFPAADGSFPWEKAPLPTHFSSNLVAQGVARLNSLGVLPTTGEALQAGLDRLSKNITRHEVEDLRAWREALRAHLQVGTSPQAQREDLVTAWVHALPATSSSEVKIATGAFEQLVATPVDQWLDPIALPHLGARSGSWTLATAVAWAQVLQGPKMRQVQKHGVGQIDLWAQLGLGPSLSRQAAWSKPVFKGNGGTVTLCGLAALSQLEHQYGDSATGLGVSAWPGEVGASEMDAALSTLQALAPHLGSFRRTQMAPFVNHLLLFFQSSKPLSEKWANTQEQMKARPLGDRLHLALSLGRARIPLLVGDTTINARAFGELLENLSPAEQACLTKADWKHVRELLVLHPVALFENQMATTRLKDAGRLGPVLPGAQEFLICPLESPYAQLNQRMMQGVDTMNRLNTDRPTEVAMWHNLLGYLRRRLTWAAASSKGQSDQGPSASLRDQIQWICAISRRFPQPSMIEETREQLWDQTRALAKAGERLPPALAHVCAQVFERPNNERAWIDLWAKSLAKDSETVHPASWLKDIGVSVSPVWVRSLLTYARQNKVLDLDRFEALTRVHLTPELPSPPASRRSRIRA